MILPAEEECLQATYTPPSIKRLLKHTPVSRDKSQDKALVSGRRESFLQDRKDRLALRRQKADQVLARKNDLQGNVSSKLEALRESLSSAQAARSAIYSKIAASGSKEVTRAQFVARQNREKLKLEREAKRRALEIKLAEAEKRRQIVLNDRILRRRSASPRGRVQTTAAQTPADAAVSIQRFWKGRVAQIRAKKFLALHLDYGTSGEVPFDVIADVIKGREVITCASRILDTLGLLDDLVQAKQEALCRVFLSTYMIVGHPKDILMRQGPLEDCLIEQARQFAGKFTRWVRAAAKGGLHSSATVNKAWTNFIEIFERWKRDDSANLVEVMVAQYCELDLIYQIVKHDSDPIVAAEYHTAIRDNQLMLLARIRRIAGEETRTMIRKAVMSARRKRLPRAPKAVAPAAKPSANVEDAVQFFAIGQRQTRLTNRQIIHELALDPSFQITNPNRSQQEIEAENTMKQNFLSTLRDEMRAGQYASWVPVIVQECKLRLLRLVMPDSPTFKSITATFDLPLIESQCKSNCYDFLGFTGIVLQMMAALCSPARDRAVSDILLLRGSDDVDLFAKRIDSIFDVLDVLLLDSANFHLTISASRLIPEAVPYEQRSFQEDLTAGRLTLEKTTTWLMHSKETLALESSNRDPEHINHVSAGHSPRGIVQHALASLISSSAEPPETLHLDVERIARYRLQAAAIARIGALMMTTKSLLRTKTAQLNPITWTTLRDRLTILMTGKSDAASVSAEVNHHLDLAHSDVEADRTERHTAVSSLVARIFSNTDPVQKLLRRRVEALIKQAMISQPSPLQFQSSGIDSITELSTLCMELATLEKVTWNCYKAHYTRILEI